MHECPTCHKQYKRHEHLQRHYASHSLNKFHRCDRCTTSFQRSDVLARHQKTCSGVNKKTSTKRQACDRCMLLKRACNLGRPCETCKRRGVHCVYTSGAIPPRGLQTDVEHGLVRITSNLTSASDNPYDDIDTSLLYPPDLEGLDNSWTEFLNFDFDPCGADALSKTSLLRFLDNFTKHTGFVDSFECGELTDRQAVLEDIEVRMSAIWQPQPVQHLAKSSLQFPGLEQQAKNIVHLIKDTVNVKKRNSAIEFTWTTELNARCASFFSPQNLWRLTELYWAIWHPNVNLIHRPNFEISKSPEMLVAGMALIGACVSPRSADKEAASLWFNCVEELVFDHEELCDWHDTASPNDLFPTKSKIQALQAAYIVCLYQNWEGTDSSKARIRRSRYSTVISVARVVGIDKAYHVQQRGMSKEADFANFIIREELIRVFLWIFLLDTAFVIFNNVPPRMSVKEMRMGFACSESLFQARTAQDWLSCLSSDDQDKDLRLSEMIRIMCQGEIEILARQHFANLGSLNLFVLASAIHSLIFQFQNSFNGDIHPPSTKNALSNWEGIWACYETSVSSNPVDAPNESMAPSAMWKRIGFMKHAKEYWMLARLVVTAAEQRNDQKKNGLAIPDTDIAANSFRLSTYDETSMRQVNQLISNLQGIDLNG